MASAYHHNSFFLWDQKTLFYTTNAGLIFSVVSTNGCQLDYLDDMNEHQLKNYYANLNVDYVDVTLTSKQIYCFNQTIDYIVVSNNEFFIHTKNGKISRRIKEYTKYIFKYF